MRVVDYLTLLPNTKVSYENCDEIYKKLKDISSKYNITIILPKAK